MCLLFLHINDDKGSGKYRLILANNRDEYWVRPTSTMEMKGDIAGKPKWIGGRDLEPGREGGTWLGLSETGRLAVLLNVLCIQHKDRRGRGNLVKDFLEADATGEDYIQEVAKDADLYNSFHLILVNLRTNPSSFHYVNSINGAVSSDIPGVFSCDNSKDLNSRWKKTEYGQEKFTNILQEGVQEEEELTEKLFHLLGDKSHPNLPDPQLYKQFTDVGYDTGRRMEERSCINVFSPNIQYGTRTRTVILMSHQGDCTYIEKTLDTETGTWTTKSEQFKINLEPDDTS